MSVHRNEGAPCLLTRLGRPSHNPLTCPSATTRRASLRPISAGKSWAKRAAHKFERPLRLGPTCLDLAGLPHVGVKVPALHLTLPHCAARNALPPRAFKPIAWRPSMAKSKTFVSATEAATPTGGAPLAGGHPGAAQPPLDLSLGHIGTRGNESEPLVRVEQLGPFRVEFDLTTGLAVVHTDAGAFQSRAERRAAERAFLRLAVRNARGLGFRFSMAGAV